MIDCRAAVGQLKCLQSPSQIALNGFPDKFAKPVMPSSSDRKCTIDLNKKQEGPLGSLHNKTATTPLLMFEKQQVYRVHLKNKEPDICTL